MRKRAKPHTRFLIQKDTDKCPTSLMHSYFLSDSSLHKQIDKKKRSTRGFPDYEMRTMRVSTRPNTQELSILWSGNCPRTGSYSIERITGCVVTAAELIPWPGAFSHCWSWRYAHWYGATTAGVDRKGVTELLECAGWSFCTADASISAIATQSLQRYIRAAAITSCICRGAEDIGLVSRVLSTNCTLIETECIWTVKEIWLHGLRSLCYY
jgi:hypothetical protein